MGNSEQQTILYVAFDKKGPVYFLSSLQTRVVQALRPDDGLDRQPSRNLIFVRIVVFIAAFKAGGIKEPFENFR